ncbi:hypothetical protein P3S68_019363 [Capsicum galapagoense]
MEITIDIYNNSSSNNNTSVFSVPLREELMKALEPFMKGASCSFPSSAASSSSPLTSFSSSFYPYSEPNLYIGFCIIPSMTTQMFSQGYLCFNHIGVAEIGSIGLNHLTPSHILQIQTQIQF